MCTYYSHVISLNASTLPKNMGCVAPTNHPFQDIRTYDTMKGVLRFASITHQGNKGSCVYSSRHIEIYGGTTIPLNFCVNGVNMLTNANFGRMLQILLDITNDGQT
jgi:hypothetical protein